MTTKPHPTAFPAAQSPSEATGDAVPVRRTVVIGAGIAGLATAALLAHEGHQVTVLERLGRVGGRAGEIRDGEFRFETGPSWYLMPEVFEHYFELLGTHVEDHLDLRMLDPGYRVFEEPGATGPSGPFDVPYGQRAVEEAFESREAGSARRLRRYLRSGDRAMDMALRFFLYNPFTKLRSLIRPAVLRALPQLVPLLTESLQARAHREVDDPVLRQVLGYPAVFLGTEPDAAPSMYHIMSTLDLRDGVRYPMGGFTSIVTALEHLARERGVRIELGAEVTAIDTVTTSSTTGRVTGVTWRDTQGVTHHGQATTVVSGADLHHTETALLPSHLRTYPQRWWDTRTSGPGAVLVMLGVRGELPQLAHHSLFFTRDWEKNFARIFGEHPSLPVPASAYVCKPSATDPDVAPEGHENLFVLVPVPAQPSYGVGGTDGDGDPAIEAAADRIIDQIAAWAHIPDLRERIVTRHTLGPGDFLNDYHSWCGGMLGQAHTLGQSAMFRESNASVRVEGLYYAGATTSPGVGVPMCLISAELVLKHLRGDHSAGPLPTPSGWDGRVSR